MMQDLTKSGNVGVRWQAQMEEHLHEVRMLSHQAGLVGLKEGARQTRATLAQAHATAAVALALANGLSDVEHELNNIADGIKEADHAARHRA